MNVVKPCSMAAGMRLIGLVATALAAGAVAAFPTAAPAGSEALAPETVVHARLIAAQVAARYRLLPGRKLTVTETTSMEVVHSVTLVTPNELPRVVSTDNGIYFALCSVGARCPYPTRAAWPPAAFLPRRMALELALRAFLETRLTLVVVALPTAEPVWVVFERDDLLGAVDAPAELDRLALEPSRHNPQLHELVDRVTRPRLFRPLPLLPPPTDTIYAQQLL
jgi:hypothetical protein